MGKTKKSTDLLQKQVSKKENIPLAAEKKIKRAKFSTILSYRIVPSKLFAIGMWAQPRPISIHFCLFETVDSYAILLMNEPQITIADCDRSAYLKA